MIDQNDEAKLPNESQIHRLITVIQKKKPQNGVFRDSLNRSPGFDIRS